MPTYAQAYDEEAALLPPGHQTVYTAETNSIAARGWKGRLLCCFSGCDLPAWGAVSLWCVAPYALFGVNMRKALRLSAVWQSLIYLVLFTIFGAHMHAFVGSVRAACQHPHGHSSPKHPNEPSQECKDAWQIMTMITVVEMLVAFVGVVYASRRRTQIRAKFGIAGSRLNDFCTWFWCPGPALCQEARTLHHNNVTDGIWFGPTKLKISPATLPPYRPPSVGVMSHN